MAQVGALHEFMGHFLSRDVSPYYGRSIHKIAGRQMNLNTVKEARTFERVYSVALEKAFYI
jgi:hypothetical protein